MSKASDALMNELHGMVAKELIDIIKNGIPQVDKDGNTVRIPAPASYIAQAVKFLKDNGIESDHGLAGKGTLSDVLKNLDAVPFDGEIPEEFKH